MNFGWLFTNLAFLAGMCYGWMNPVFGLMVFYAFSILRPTELWFWAEWPFRRFSFYLGIATLIGWVFNGFGNWSGLRPIRLPLAGLGLYLFCGLLTCGIGINPTRAWFYFYPQLTIGVMAMVTITLVRGEKAIRWFTYMVIISMGYLAWVFNSQYVFDGWNRVYWNGFAAVDNNGVAMMMVSAVPMTFFMGVHDRRIWAKGLCCFAGLMLIHVVLLSFSRGGQLGLLMVGMGIFFVAITQLPNKGLTILLGLVLVAGTIHLAGAQVRDEFWSIFVDPEARDASAASRFNTWGAAWRCMLDHPLGLGPRNFNLISDRYGLVRGKSVHNLFLQTGADYGFVGMIGLSMFYFGAIWKTFWMTTTPLAKRLVWPRYIGHMSSMSLGGFLVCSTFIGMESVEIGYLVALIGLCTVRYVHAVGSTETADSEAEARSGSLEEPDPYETFGEVTTI